MSGKNIITPWSFRDGRDYVIALSTTETPSSSISIRVSDKVTAEEWSCSYDSKYVESLTQRTGSYKKFEVFVSMLKSAILKKSESVALELMNIDDLEILRTQRQQSVGTFGSNEGGQISPTTHLSPIRKFGDKSQIAISSNSKKKYLIVTYVAEFDKVHYPIPLNYSGPPDPQIMQNSIRKLKSEVSTLRNAKVALEEEVLQLKQDKLTSHKNSSKSTSDDFGSEFPRDHVNNNQNVHHQPLESLNLHELSAGISIPNHYSNPEDETKIQQLMSIIRKLEERILLEQTNNHEKISKLQAQNDFIVRKLEGVEKCKFELENEIHQLKDQLLFANEELQQYESQMRANVRGREDTYRNNNNKVRSGYHNYNYPYNFNYRDVREQPDYRGYMKAANCRDRCSSTESFRGLENYRVSIHGRRDLSHERGRYPRSSNVISSPQRQRSLSPAVMRRSTEKSRYSARVQPRSRSSSPAKPPFDPTAYIAEKRLKQEKMAQLRLDNIRSRLRDSSTSSQERGARTRSNSRDSASCRSSSNLRNKDQSSPTCSLCGKECKGKCFGRRKIAEHTHNSGQISIRSRSPSPHGSVGRTSLKTSPQRRSILHRPPTPGPAPCRKTSNNQSTFPELKGTHTVNMGERGTIPRENLPEVEPNNFRYSKDDKNLGRTASTGLIPELMRSNYGRSEESSHPSKLETRKSNNNTNKISSPTSKGSRKTFRNINHDSNKDKKATRQVDFKTKLRDLQNFLSLNSHHNRKK